MTPLPIIERFSIVAPLGVCFHDTATGERVLNGLEVTAYPANSDTWKNKTVLRPNRFGVFVLQRINGLENFSRGIGDDDFWKNNPSEKSYIIEVSDLDRRFQPFKFTVELPVKGVYKWANIPPTSPNKNIDSIPLYSAPTRKIPGAMSYVRAHLQETDGVSASNAILEAGFGGKLIARGIADRDGQVVLIFPELAPQSKPLSSPPSSSTHVLLAEQKWNLDLTVKYQPKIFQTSPPETVAGEAENLPDLRLVLAQKKGKIWADSGQTEEKNTVVLQTGKELVLHSLKKAITSPPAAKTDFSSFLFVSPAN